MGLLQNWQDKLAKKHLKKALLINIGPFLGVLILAILLIYVSLFYGAVLADKKNLIQDAGTAYANLNSAYASLDRDGLVKASDLFSRADETFGNLEHGLADLAKPLSPAAPSVLEAGVHFARAGQAVASAGKFFLKSIDSLTAVAPALSGVLTLDSSRGLEDTKQGSAAPAISSQIASARDNLNWSRELIHLAKSELEAINPQSLPEAYRADLSQALNKIEQLEISLNTLVSINNVLAEVVSGYQRNILLVFQNTAETRPTGGFIGSYGLLKLRSGQIKSLLIESTYEIDGRLQKSIPPPEPLRSVAGEKWALRDANWWPDFAYSGKQISSFYEWEGGESVDLVIAFTPELFAEIITVLGPTDLPEYGAVIDSTNFYELLQSRTSKGYDRDENKPKKFMTDLAGKLMQKIPALPSEEKIAILASILNHIQQKNILFYSRLEGLQENIERAGLGGRLVELENYGNFDSLLVTNANVGGGKTDKHIKQEVLLTTRIEGGGRVVNNLKIKRSNNTPPFAENPVNQNYLRIYVPLASKLISATREVATYEELGRSVFAVGSTLAAGQSDELEIEYSLPPRLWHNLSHALLVEKNPGQLLDSFDYLLILPKGKQIVHTIGEANINERGLAAGARPLSGNVLFGAVFK